MLGMRHQRPPVSRCSSLCYLYKESRDRFSYTSIPSAQCGHMGWGYRMECMLVGEKKKKIILVDLCASCSLRLDLLSFPYTQPVKSFRAPRVPYVLLRFRMNVE